MLDPWERNGSSDRKIYSMSNVSPHKSASVMIRVLQFADIINRHDFIDTIVEYADRERFEVSVCVRSEQHNIARPDFGPDVRYHYLPGNSRRDAVQTAWKLSQLLKEWKIDILHAHHFEQAIVGWLATRFNRSTKL